MKNKLGVLVCFLFLFSPAAYAENFPLKAEIETSLKSVTVGEVFSVRAKVTNVSKDTLEMECWNLTPHFNWFSDNPILKNQIQNVRQNLPFKKILVPGESYEAFLNFYFSGNTTNQKVNFRLKFKAELWDSFLHTKPDQEPRYIESEWSNVLTVKVSDK